MRAQLLFAASSDLLLASECRYFISLVLCASGYLVVPLVVLPSLVLTQGAMCYVFLPLALEGIGYCTKSNP